MADVITQTDLENAHRDTSDLGLFLNAAADAANPGQANGTVTNRVGSTFNNLAKIVAALMSSVSAAATSASNAAASAAAAAISQAAAAASATGTATSAADSAASAAASAVSAALALTSSQSAGVSAAQAVTAASTIISTLGAVVPYFAANIFQAAQSNGWEFTWNPPTNLSLNQVPVFRAAFDDTLAPVIEVEQFKMTSRVAQPWPATTNNVTPTYYATDVAWNDFLYSSDFMYGIPNPSTLVSPKPKPYWAMPSRLLVGNTVHWEIGAFHRNARRNKQISGVRVRATDGTTYTPWQTVATPTLSTTVEEPCPSEVYQGDLDVSALANPALIWLEAEVYPRIGTAVSVTSNVGVTDTRGFSQRYFTRDTARAAAPPLVYVASTGNDGTGVCSATAATAAASPFLTVQGAITGMIAATAVSGGKVDGGRVRIVDTVSVGTFNTAINRRQDSATLIIERAPGTARAAAIVQQSAVASFKFGTPGTLDSHLTYAYLTLYDVSWQRTAVGQIGNATATPALHLQLWNCNVDNGGQTGVWSNSGVQSIFGLTWTNYASQNFGYTTNLIQPIYRGLTADFAGGSMESTTIVGCQITNGGIGATADRTKSPIIYNNKWLKCASGTGIISIIADNAGDVLDRPVVLQNLIERISSNGALSLALSNDSAHGSLYSAICGHNTLTGYSTGGRTNWYYDETHGTERRFHSLGLSVGNIHVQANIKNSVYLATNGGGSPDTTNGPFATGGHQQMHGVGRYGDFVQFDNQAPATEDHTYDGIGTIKGTSSSVRLDPLFVNYQGTTGTGGTPVAGVGGGDYHLQSGSPARGIVPIAILGRDIDGVLRPTGAQDAGCFVNP